MKILVFAYDLVFSGVTVNAIELSAMLRDAHGHDVVLFAAPGPMLEMAKEKRLRFIPAPAAFGRVHPSPVRMRALRDVVRAESPDLIYAWDWVQCLDSFYGEHLTRRVPLVVTDMSMTLQRMLPKGVPTTFGTPELVDQARSEGYRNVELLLPPVDMQLNSIDAVDRMALRRQYGVADDQILLATVSRLDTHMKAEGLYNTLEAVRTLGRELPLSFAIVGEGDQRANLERLAATANAELGRTAVFLTGGLVDPRPAYAAADIVVGMGSSGLRAMAFGKPVIIVGIKGFSAPFTSETVKSFYYHGIYGYGDGTPVIAEQIRAMASRPELLPAAGEFARQWVHEHFSLETVSTRLSNFCGAAVANQPPMSADVLDGMRTAAFWAKQRRFFASR